MQGNVINCQNEGIVWFKTCGLWQDNGYIPKSRRNNIFWLGKVYTIEGNSNDSCAERNYDINSSVIVGYGTPMF